MTEHQLIQQVIQGGGNMPAYANQLSPPETTALARFLMSLRAGEQPVARTAAGRLEE
jgi:ubiquinol-cytochrome c reductase cytochrome b subunit